MKVTKFIILIFLSLYSMSLCAENLIKYDYKTKTIQKTKTENIELTGLKVPDTEAVYLSLERIIFNSGQYLYLVELKFEQSKRIDIAKELPITIKTKTKSQITATQMAVNVEAKNSFKNKAGKTVYWNISKFAVEPKDLERLLLDVESIDFATDLTPDGYLQLYFKKNSFSQALRKLAQAIIDSKTPTYVLEDYLYRFVQNQNSKTIVTKNLAINSEKNQYLLSMTYIYYKESNTEDYDLHIVIRNLGKQLIPFGTKVDFTLPSSEVISLRQEQDNQGQLLLYPKLEQIKKLKEGISSISFKLDNVDFTDKLDKTEVSNVIDKLYNSLQSIANL